MTPWWLYLVGGASLAAVGAALWLVLEGAATRAAKRDREAWDDWTRGIR